MSVIRVSEHVTVTTAPFDKTCLYDDKPFNSWAVELHDSTTQTLWVTVALRNVDRVREILADEACHSYDGLERETVDNRRCLVCGNTVTGQAAVFEQHPNPAIHDDCQSKAVRELNKVWTEAGELLSEELSE